ncbi:MAG: hypothetical protein KDD96_03265 [Rhodobacteraceae bacterium]|nr:hypothetical protein [Paracoccaceae bacterium]
MFQIGLALEAARRAAPSAPLPAPHHVFVVAGDANASGRAPETDLDVYPESARHWAALDSWAPVGSRLYHGPWETGAVARPDPAANHGWARAFANAYQAAFPDNAVHLIGVARDASGFANGTWTRGNSAYEAAVARVNAALAALPGNAVLRGILWHQGDADSQAPATLAGYANALDQCIDNLREDIAAANGSTPFVVGGHAPLSGLYHPVVQNTCQSCVNRKPHTGYADPSVPTEATLFDGLHLTAASNAAMGQAYLAGLLEAEANVSTAPTGPVTPGGLAHYPLPRAIVSSVAGVSLGTANADRIIILAVTARSDVAIRPISVKVGAIPLTRAGTPELGGDLCGVTFYYGRIPFGTSATVEVTFDALCYNGQAAIAVLPVYGARLHLANAAGYASAQSAVGTTAIGATVEAEQGDLVVALVAGVSNTPAATINLAQTLSSIAGNVKYGVYSGAGIAASTGPFALSCQFPLSHVRVGLGVLVLRPA